MDNGIKISVEEYLALNTHDNILHFFVEALKNAARLNYSGDGLSFDYDVIDGAFKLLMHDTYESTLKRLQVDKEFEKGE